MIAQTLTVHHGALVYPARDQRLLRASSRRGSDRGHAETLRGHRVLHLVGKGSKPATMPLTVPVLRVLEAAAAGPKGPHPPAELGKPIDRRDVYRMCAS